MISMKSWDAETDDETTLRFASGLAEKFFARLGPASDELSAMLHSRDYRRLLDTTPDFSRDAEHYRNYAAGLGMLKKLPCLPLGVDKTVAAMEKFLSGESACRETNYLFNLWKRGEFQFCPVVERILHSSARKIQKIVGSVPDVKNVRYRFSPGGASTSTKKKDSEVRSLIANVGHCSEELACDTDLIGSILATVPHLAKWLNADGGATDSCLLTIDRTRLDFVPKDAKTFRVITVEPDMNKFVQNGYGDELRKRAKRAGIDLSDQSRNSELARLGSLNNRIATVDLTNASGLMAYALIEHLWPPEWFEVFASIRSAHTSYRGKQFTMHAYAGMGNGTTFPVESITFFCLAEACVEEAGEVGPVSAYGDDLIIPSAAMGLLTRVFADVGLSVNSEKSFSSGPFRESCGSDWFLGYAVRPAYLRGNLSVRRLFLLHNHYYRLGDYEAASWFLELIPYQFRIYGPDGYGDGHLLGDWVGKRYWSKHTVKHGTGCSCYEDGRQHTSECFKTTVVKTKTSLYTFETYTYRTSPLFRATLVDGIIPSYSVYSSLVSKTPYSVHGPVAINTQLVRFINEHTIGIKEAVGLRCEQYNARSSPDKRKAAWFELPPGSEVWVIGTPMPGTHGVKRTTVTTFEQPSLLN